MKAGRLSVGAVADSLRSRTAGVAEIAGVPSADAESLFDDVDFTALAQRIVTTAGRKAWEQSVVLTKDHAPVILITVAPGDEERAYTLTMPNRHLVVDDSTATIMAALQRFLNVTPGGNSWQSS